MGGNHCRIRGDSLLAKVGRGLQYFQPRRALEVGGKRDFVGFKECGRCPGKLTITNVSFERGTNFKRTFHRTQPSSVRDVYWDEFVFKILSLSHYGFWKVFTTCCFVFVGLFWSWFSWWRAVVSFVFWMGGFHRLAFCNMRIHIHSPWRIMVGRLLSSGEWLFSRGYVKLQEWSGMYISCFSCTDIQIQLNTVYNFTCDLFLSGPRDNGQ